MPHAYNLKGLVGWLVFLAILVLSWDSSISRVMALMEPFATVATSTKPASRLILFLVGAYGACRVALLVCLSMLLLYCAMTCVQCVLPLLPQSAFVWRLAEWLFDEDVLFDPLLPGFLGFHLAVFGGALSLALLFACVSVQDRDLEQPDALRSAVVRESLSMACVSVFAYLGVLVIVSTRS